MPREVEHLNARSKDLFRERTDRLRRPDVPLYVVTALLLVFGVVMVYSASSYNAEMNYGSKYFFMIKQIFGVVGGAAAMTAMTL